MCLEEALPGRFKKYSDNFGKLDIHAGTTPHSFSHFTWHATKGKLMVVDVQGCKLQDKYLMTDPGIHSNFGRKEPYGGTDFGEEGMDKFFESHSCNPACKALGLLVSPKQTAQSQQDLMMSVVRRR
jgi:hypothetical protein